MCEPLWGSMPIVTTIKSSFSSLGKLVTQRARLISGTMALAPLISHATRKARRASTSFGSQASSGRQTVSEPTHQTSRRYGLAVHLGGYTINNN